LAAVQSFVANQGDSWRWLPGALSGTDETSRAALLDAIRLLGTRTGELHVALGQGTGDAFAPEPYTRADTEAFEERLGREVRTTTATLHRMGACSYVESEELAGALLRDISGAGLLEGLPRTRVHGDYHLGQVLRADGDFVIIDFEGEPSRSLAERRQKASPLKDVAGMARSIDYAVASAHLTADSGAGDAGLVAWGEAAEQAFLQGYLHAVSASTLTLVPLDPVAFRQALDLFMIEKALYEVRYELDNRPDWLEIPLGALRRIAQGH
jgi:maltose alpha-D-glucosyltransferase/alpha-amylase